MQTQPGHAHQRVKVSGRANHEGVLYKLHIMFPWSFNLSFIKRGRTWRHKGTDNRIWQAYNMPTQNQEVSYPKKGNSWIFQVIFVVVDAPMAPNVMLGPVVAPYLILIQFELDNGKASLKPQNLPAKKIGKQAITEALVGISSALRCDSRTWKKSPKAD
ncbi:hypothetical protein Cgig2_032213 [Carnegiea gigantea]|uniref:Uncharacterized protein n=1 Tax=Carnegiea gigantea TaxID=171969 RepID=A0A9Q1GP73_9CARY|nr:hypothetical protein Cgig2_032213 [Carnegiea gigantea]